MVGSPYWLGGGVESGRFSGSTGRRVVLPGSLLRGESPKGKGKGSSSHTVPFSPALVYEPAHTLLSNSFLNVYGILHSPEFPIHNFLFRDSVYDIFLHVFYFSNTLYPNSRITV